MSMPVNRFRADRIGPPPLPVKSQPLQKTKAIQKVETFADHLMRACKEVDCKLKFSGHAQSRVDSRGINLNKEQIVRLDKAVESAAIKGSSKALIMLDDTALIVGVGSRTVVTVVDKDGLKDNVFTSIDSAIVA